MVENNTGPDILSRTELSSAMGETFVGVEKNPFHDSSGMVVGAISQDSANIVFDDVKIDPAVDQDKVDDFKRTKIAQSLAEIQRLDSSLGIQLSADQIKNLGTDVQKKLKGLGLSGILLQSHRDVFSGIAGFVPTEGDMYGSIATTAFLHKINTSGTTDPDALMREAVQYAHDVVGSLQARETRMLGDQDLPDNVQFTAAMVKADGSAVMFSTGHHEIAVVDGNGDIQNPTSEGFNHQPLGRVLNLGSGQTQQYTLNLDGIQEIPAEKLQGKLFIGKEGLTKQLKTLESDTRKGDLASLGREVVRGHERLPKGPIKENIIYGGRARLVTDTHGGEDVRKLGSKPTPSSTRNERPLAPFLEDWKPELGELLIHNGDIADRGTQSWGMIEQVMDMVEKGEAVFNLGNHELFVLATMAGDNFNFRNWLWNGGADTLDGMGIDISAFKAATDGKSDAEIGTFLKKAGAQGTSEKVIIDQLFQEVQNNEKMKRFSTFLQQHAKGYTIFDNVLTTHAGIMVEDNGDLKDLPQFVKNAMTLDANKNKELKGLDGLDAIQAELRAGNIGIATALLQQRSDDNPFWVRKAFHGAIQDQKKGTHIREQINAQATKTKRGTQVELMAFGHTPTRDAQATVATKSLKVRYLFADAGFVESHEARVLKLFVQPENPTELTTIFQDPRKGQKRSIWESSYTMDRSVEPARVDGTSTAAAEVRKVPPKAAPPDEDETTADNSANAQQIASANKLAEVIEPQPAPAAEPSHPLPARPQRVEKTPGQQDPAIAAVEAAIKRTDLSPDGHKYPLYINDEKIIPMEEVPKYLVMPDGDGDFIDFQEVTQRLIETNLPQNPSLQSQIQLLAQLEQRVQFEGDFATGKPNDALYQQTLQYGNHDTLLMAIRYHKAVLMKKSNESRTRKDDLAYSNWEREGESLQRRYWKNVLENTTGVRSLTNKAVPMHENKVLLANAHEALQGFDFVAQSLMDIPLSRLGTNTDGTAKTYRQVFDALQGQIGKDPMASKSLLQQRRDFYKLAQEALSRRNFQVDPAVVSGQAGQSKEVEVQKMIGQIQRLGNEFGTDAAGMVDKYYKKPSGDPITPDGSRRTEMVDYVRRHAGGVVLDQALMGAELMYRRSLLNNAPQARYDIPEGIPTVVFVQGYNEHLQRMTDLQQVSTAPGQNRVQSMGAQNQGANAESHIPAPPVEPASSADRTQQSRTQSEAAAPVAEANAVAPAPTAEADAALDADTLGETPAPDGNSNVTGDEQESMAPVPGAEGTRATESDTRPAEVPQVLYVGVAATDHSAEQSVAAAKHLRAEDIRRLETFTPKNKTGEKRPSIFRPFARGRYDRQALAYTEPSAPVDKWWKVPARIRHWNHRRIYNGLRREQADHAGPRTFIGGLMYPIRHPGRFIRKTWQKSINTDAFETRETYFASGVTNIAKASLGLHKNAPISMNQDQYQHVLDKGKELREKKGRLGKVAAVIRNGFSGVTGMKLTTEEKLGMDWLKSEEGRKYLTENVLPNTIIDQNDLGARYALMPKGDNGQEVPAQNLQGAIQMANESVISSDRQETRRYVSSELLGTDFDTQLKELLKAYTAKKYEDGRPENIQRAEAQAKLMSDFITLLESNNVAKRYLTGTDVATNIVQIGENLKASVSNQGPESLAKIDAMEIRLLAGKAEWGGAAGNLNELGPFNKVRWLAQRLADRGYGIDRKGRIQETGRVGKLETAVNYAMDYVKDFGTIGVAAYGASYGTAIASVAAKPLTKFVLPFAGAVVGGIREGGLNLKIGQSMYGIAGHKLHEYAQASYEHAIGRKSPEGASARQEFEKAMVGARTVESLMKPISSLLAKDTLTPAEQRTMAIHLADIKTRLQMTDVNSRRRGLRLGLPQNFIQYAEGKENQQMTQLRQALLVGAGKLNGEFADRYKHTALVMQAQLRQGGINSESIVAAVMGEAQKQGIQLNRQEISSIQTQIAEAGLTVKQEESLKHAMNNLSWLNIKSSVKVASVSAVGAFIAAPVLQGTIHVLGEAAQAIDAYAGGQISAAASRITEPIAQASVRALGGLRAAGRGALRGSAKYMEHVQDVGPAKAAGEAWAGATALPGHLQDAWNNRPEWSDVTDGATRLAGNMGQGIQDFGRARMLDAGRIAAEVQESNQRWIDVMNMKVIEVDVVNGHYQSPISPIEQAARAVVFGIREKLGQTPPVDHYDVTTVSGTNLKLPSYLQYVNDGQHEALVDTRSFEVMDFSTQHISHDGLNLQITPSGSSTAESATGFFESHDMPLKVEGVSQVHEAIVKKLSGGEMKAAVLEVIQKGNGVVNHLQTQIPEGTVWMRSGEPGDYRYHLCLEGDAPGTPYVDATGHTVVVAKDIKFATVDPNTTGYYVEGVHFISSDIKAEPDLVQITHHATETRPNGEFLFTKNETVFDVDEDLLAPRFEIDAEPLISVDSLTGEMEVPKIPQLVVEKLGDDDTWIMPPFIRRSLEKSVADEKSKKETRTIVGNRIFTEPQRRTQTQSQPQTQTAQSTQPPPAQQPQNTATPRAAPAEAASTVKPEEEEEEEETPKVTNNNPKTKEEILGQLNEGPKRENRKKEYFRVWEERKKAYKEKLLKDVQSDDINMQRVLLQITGEPDIETLRQKVSTPELESILIKIHQDRFGTAELDDVMKAALKPSEKEVMEKVGKAQSDSELRNKLANFESYVSQANSQNLDTEAYQQKWDELVGENESITFMDYFLYTELMRNIRRAITELRVRVLPDLMNEYNTFEQEKKASN